MRRRASLAWAMAIGLVGSPAIAAAAPPNDGFADAGELTGFPVGVSTSIRAGPTVSWRWTAPLSGHVAVDVCPSPHPSGASADVAVYTGDGPASLAATGASGANLDKCARAGPGGARPAIGDRVAFVAEMGRTYSIAVSRGFSDGPVRLHLARAGHVRLEVVSGPDGVRRARMVYVAASGERNGAVFSFDWADSAAPGYQPRRPAGDSSGPRAFVVTSADAVSAGPGCVFADAPWGMPDCAIPAGLRAAGPVVYLGDGDDTVSVAYSNARTVISGGAGDDGIRANGEIGGGPGNDWISPFKLHTSGLRVTGGRGHDVIEGTKLRDTVDPGPGNDVIDLEGASRYGGEHIDTRDGEIDYLFCYRQDRADIDQFDEYPDDFCRHVRRHGGPARAIPDREPFQDGLFGPELWLSCPADGPLECSGDVTVSRRGAVVFRKDFRTERYRRSNATVELAFRAGRRKLRGYEGDVRITVRSHDRAGRLRTAARTYEYPDGPYREGTLP